MVVTMNKCKSSTTFPFKLKFVPIHWLWKYMYSIQWVIGALEKFSFWEKWLAIAHLSVLYVHSILRCCWCGLLHYYYYYRNAFVFHLSSTLQIAHHKLLEKDFPSAILFFYSFLFSVLMIELFWIRHHHHIKSCGSLLFMIAIASWKFTL